MTQNPPGPPGTADEAAVPRPPVISAARAVAAVLLVAPFLGLLTVGSYAKATPRIAGVPFFYWYQIAWVVLAALLTGVAGVLIRRDQIRREQWGAQR